MSEADRHALQRFVAGLDVEADALAERDHPPGARGGDRRRGAAAPAGQRRGRGAPAHGAADRRHGLARAAGRRAPAGARADRRGRAHPRGGGRGVGGPHAGARARACRSDAGSRCWRSRPRTVRGRRVRLRAGRTRGRTVRRRAADRARGRDPARPSRACRRRSRVRVRRSSCSTWSSLARPTPVSPRGAVTIVFAPELGTLAEIAERLSSCELVVFDGLTSRKARSSASIRTPRAARRRARGRAPPPTRAAPRRCRGTPGRRARRRCGSRDRPATTGRPRRRQSRAPWLSPARAALSPRLKSTCGNSDSRR